MISRNCKAETKAGSPCQMAPLRGSSWCWNHDPGRARDRQAARKRGGLNRRRSKADLSVEVRLDDVAALREILETAVRDTLVLENSVARSRTLGYLVGQALRALEFAELAERVAAVEESFAALTAPPESGRYPWQT